jgi:hypothetical protein
MAQAPLFYRPIRLIVAKLSAYTLRLRDSAVRILTAESQRRGDLRGRRKKEPAARQGDTAGQVKSKDYLGSDPAASDSQAAQGGQ